MNDMIRTRPHYVRSSMWGSLPKRQQKFGAESIDESLDWVSSLVFKINSS